MLFAFGCILRRSKRLVVAAPLWYPAAATPLLLIQRQLRLICRQSCSIYLFNSVMHSRYHQQKAFFSTRVSYVNNAGNLPVDFCRNGLLRCAFSVHLKIHPIQVKGVVGENQ